MTASLDIDETAIFTALHTALGRFGLVPSVAGAPVPIIRGQANRVPEPGQVDYLVMWSLRRDRLSTNVDTTLDDVVTGAFAGNVLTVSAVSGPRPLVAGMSLYGATVTQSCEIVSQLSGSLGGVGAYAVLPTADSPAGPLWAGTLAVMQPMQMTIQLDIHGPASADNAVRVSSLMRDFYGVDAFRGTGVAPLYADDPHQIPFQNAEQQYEERWVIDICLQANPTVTVGQQFADKAIVAPVLVDTFYPL